MSDGFIAAAVIAVTGSLYLLIGAILAKLLGIQDTLFWIGVMLGWPLVLLFMLLVVLIGIRLIRATSDAVMGR